MNVLIAGGASGLGLATAEAVEKEGWRALVVDVREPDQRFDHVAAVVAQTVVFALPQPAGCGVRELVVCPSTETSWS
ncbi:hypothetical protein ACFFV7_08265 [Nonomuraea spiralis]|uniref:Uncharacterized protein n=1 Tax=Nonomuraea spiralis TaxID=46182 RepID=A0ABV5I9F9_9ACTN|nr:hypothetical protein [Nonomuraea spiralis]GGT07004.1 hypothetical protein GCM10010176_059350 [Nonomuraea spiralis]